MYLYSYSAQCQKVESNLIFHISNTHASEALIVLHMQPPRGSQRGADALRPLCPRQTETSSPYGVHSGRPPARAQTLSANLAQLGLVLNNWLFRPEINSSRAAAAPRHIALTHNGFCGSNISAEMKVKTIYNPVIKQS